MIRYQSGLNTAAIDRIDAEHLAENPNYFVLFCHKCNLLHDRRIACLRQPKADRS